MAQQLKLHLKFNLRNNKNDIICKIWQPASTESDVLIPKMFRGGKHRLSVSRELNLIENYVITNLFSFVIAENILELDI